MRKKYQTFLVLFLVLTLLDFTYNAFADGEPLNVKKVDVKKIVLGRFGSKDNKMEKLPIDVPDWKFLDRRRVDIDDNDIIYVLNMKNKEIKVYDDSGTLVDNIKLKFLEGKKIDDPYWPSVNVSDDGKRLYVYNTLTRTHDIIDRKGNLLKSVKIVNDLNRRSCGDTFSDYYGMNIFDRDLNLILNSDKKFQWHRDNLGNYFSIGRNAAGVQVVEKRSLDTGNLVWARPITYPGDIKYYQIVGLDSLNNLYLTASRKGMSLFFKFDKDVKPIAYAELPDPFPFSDEDRKELEYYASEEPFEFYRVNCKGNVYVIYSMYQYPSNAYQRWLDGGEYFIHKIEFSP